MIPENHIISWLGISEKCKVGQILFLKIKIKIKIKRSFGYDVYAKADYLWQTGKNE